MHVSDSARSFVPMMLVALLLAGCTTSHVYIDEAYREPPAIPSAEPDYQVFLVGDAGMASTEAPNPLLALLRRRLHAAGPRGAVVFLGDNIYPAGLPDSADAGRARAEARLMAQLDAVRDFPGRILFVPGNHDWQNSGPDGLETLRRQEQFVEASLGRGNTFLPDDGFPGPAEVELTDRLTLVALDTEWWLRDREKSFGDAGEFDVHSAGDFLFELETLVKRNHDKDLLVVGHHPVFSNGEHAGRAPLRMHLTPLPLLGSIMPLYRRLVGERQDLADERYAALRKGLIRAFATHEDLIYAAGHEHNLQYFRHRGDRAVQHYLVSGAGSRRDFAARGGGSVFTAHDMQGLMVVNYYADGAVWLEAWSPEDGDTTGELLFRTRIKEARPTAPSASRTSVPDSVGPVWVDSTTVMAANAAYGRSSAVGRWLLGTHRRQAWVTPVEAPFFDLDHTAGRLRPVRAGGRGQSSTLRLEDADGRQFVLRSVDKTAGRAWPAEMRGTFAHALTQDQISMLHPYAAFVVPPLAEAAGVYHTLPRLVYVPDDPRLGVIGEPLVGQLAMFEERPDEDMSHLDRMGRSENVVGSRKMLLEVTGDNDHRVDARAFARARLFDMLVGDWDRHIDQWRWTTFEPADRQGKIYRPVPLDRDVAFMRMNGVLPNLARRMVLRKYQSFGPELRNLHLLNRNGLSLDRRFAGALTRDDWAGLADSLRMALPDSVIEAAVRQWPDPIYALDGVETAASLKARRDQLEEAAVQYYRLLSRVPDVVGSNKHERFEVTRLSDEETEVTVYKTRRNGEIRSLLHRRVYRTGETTEIRLYGLGGDDRFIVTGDVRKGPRLIAVGGRGEDVFVDSSRVGGPRRRTWFLDTESGNTWTTGAETRVTRSDNPAVNAYAMDALRFNSVLPLPYFGYNVDDGLLVGGGARWVRHGFRLEPYARVHRLRANFSAFTRAVNLRYDANVTNAFGPLDFAVDLELLSPDNIRTFYGLGNDAPAEVDDATFYQARLARYGVALALQNHTREGVRFRFGPTLSQTKVRRDADRFITTPQADVDPAVFDPLWYVGLDGALTLENVDRPVNPRQGVRWVSQVLARFDALSPGAAETYGAMSTDVTLFISPSLSPQLTFAPRIGAGHNVGSFPFYAAQTLGGSETLRGHRSDRFAGRTRAYANVDLRARLKEFATYLAVGELGVLGFLDTGRVWVDDDRSDTWHHGYGGGLWLNLFDAAVLTAAYARSPEGQTVTVQVGFQY